MADGYDGYEECAPRKVRVPQPQDPIDKLKDAGIPTGQAITINHVIQMTQHETITAVDKMLVMLRDEVNAKMEAEKANSNTGRYIVTVALACFAAIGFVAGKVFG